MAKTFPLHALFKAIHEAVTEATAVAREASVQAMQADYFTPLHDEDGNPTGTLKPKTLSLMLPTPEGGGLKQVQYDVPLYALAKHQSMSIDTLKMDFEVELHGLDALVTSEEGPDTKALIASTPAGVFSRKTIARVEVTFKGDDPPEGVMRINDQILKTIPS